MTLIKQEKQLKIRYLLLFSILACCYIFAGCGAAIVGGAAYGGFKGATDERSIGAMVDDSVLSTKIKSKMINDDFVKAHHIDVDVLNGIVYLIGVVESSSQRRMAADLARGVEDVQGVKNQLVVGSTSVAQVLNDTMLSSKIRVKLLQEPDIRSTNIDIDTNNSIITLTGIVSTQQEKNKIIYVVHKAAGNRQIVNNIKIKN